MTDTTRSDAAKLAAKTRKLNKLRAAAEAAVNALPQREQIALARTTLASAMYEAQSAARKIWDCAAYTKDDARRVFWHVNSAINGLKSDLDQQHQNFDWYVANSGVEK